MKFKALLLAAAIMVSVTADAKIFIAKWTGDLLGNSATATGTFDINTAVYPDLGGVEILHRVGPDFQVLSLTITGASSGNGVFTQSDFDAVSYGFTFAAATPLNYNVELVGQLMGNGYKFGDFGPGYGGPSGDFNLFGATPGSPNGGFFLQLTTDNGSGDTLMLMSLAPGGVPEPAAWALMIAGFGLVGTALRRRTVALAA